MGDFNARTQSRQCETYDFRDPILLNMVSPEDTGSTHLSADGGVDNTRYGHHLLKLGARHHLVIYII